MKSIRITNNTDPAVLEVVKTLQNGGLVVAPSDTVYGLLADATNAQAVSKLLAFKSRPAGKPISVFTYSIAELLNIGTVNNKSLLTQFLPGPYTILTRSNHIVDSRLEAEDGTIGVRIPNYEFLLQVSKMFGKPITATSANISGKGPHYSPQALLQTLNADKLSLLDVMVDNGELPRNKPSTLVNLSVETPHTALRIGDVAITSFKTVHTNTPEETWECVKPTLESYFKKHLTHAHIILLSGELGAGKTYIAKQIGTLFGVNDIVSPTYIGMYEYALSHAKFQRLLHVDLYNQTSVADVAALKLDSEASKTGNLIVIEWPEMGYSIEEWKKQYAIVQFHLESRSEHERVITVLTYH